MQQAGNGEELALNGLGEGAQMRIRGGKIQSLAGNMDEGKQGTAIPVK